MILGTRPILVLTFFILIAAAKGIYCQNKSQPQWKELQAEGGFYCWYDSTSILDKGDGIFEVWLIELHKPAVRLEGIEGAIYRTKTHLTVNRKTKKYGILHAVFIGFNSEILESIDYNLESSAEQFRHYLPIMPNTHIEKLLQVYDKQSKRDKF